MSTWDVCMSPGNTCKWIIKSDKPNPLQNLLGYTAQAWKPCTCLDLRPKKDPGVDRDSRGFNRWDVLNVWSKRVLERHPLWIAEDREHTAAAAARATGLSPRWMMTDEKFPVLGWLRSWLSKFKCFQLCTSLKFPSVKSATCNRLCVVMACDLKVEDLGSWERKVVGNRSAGIGSLRWEWHRQSKGTK